MDVILNPEEIRVLGSLIEKQITTPDYYPLTLNALMHACNQKSNRDPAVSYDETTVLRILDGLREKKLTRAVSLADSRVAKYRQIFTDTANLTDQELGILCVLMLRGFQTPGELRGRTERLCSFSSLEEVEKTLQRMREKREGCWVTQLPRQPGFKESRWAHLLGGEIGEETLNASTNAPPVSTSTEVARITQLEEQVRSLQQEILTLKQQFNEFRRQFE
jgi:uncharacterized protein YceH (UPF0502 family)